MDSGQCAVGVDLENFSKTARGQISSRQQSNDQMRTNELAPQHKANASPAPTRQRLQGSSRADATAAS